MPPVVTLTFPGKISPGEEKMFTTDNMTPFQLAKLVKDVLGVRPTTYGEKVIKANITEGYCAVQIERTKTAQRGRREISATCTVVKVWEQTPDGWRLIQSISGESTVTDVLAFDCPTYHEKATQKHYETLGRPLDRDGYRRPIPQGV
jgi:hypothetical protein